MTMETSVRVDMNGNLVRKAGQNEKALGRMSRRGQRHLRGLSREASMTSKMISKLGNRYTAAGVAAAGFAAAKAAIDFDAQLVQFGVNADIDKDQLAKVKKKIFEVATDPDIRVNPSSLLAGLEEIAAKTGKAELGIDNLHSLALAIRATGAEGKDAASLISNLYTKFKIEDGQQLLEQLDMIAVLGKKGAFEMRDLATEGNAVGAAWAKTGRTGPVAAQEMVAMLQMIRDEVSSSAETSTAFETMIISIYAKHAAKLEKSGVKVWDEELSKKEGRKIGRSPTAVMNDIAKKWGDDKETMLKIFDVRGVRAADAFAKDFLTHGYMKKMEELMAVRSDGSQLKSDARRNAGTAKAALTQLNTRQKQASDRVLGTVAQRTANASDMVARGDAGGAAMYSLRQWGGDSIALNNALGGLMLDAGKAVAKFFETNSAGYANSMRSKVDVGGTLKIEIDGPAKVKDARSNSDALDLEVESGIGVGAL